MDNFFTELQNLIQTRKERETKTAIHREEVFQIIHNQSEQEKLDRVKPQLKPTLKKLQLLQKAHAIDKHNRSLEIGVLHTEIEPFQQAEYKPGCIYILFEKSIFLDYADKAFDTPYRISSYSSSGSLSFNDFYQTEADFSRALLLCLSEDLESLGKLDLSIYSPKVQDALDIE